MTSGAALDSGHAGAYIRYNADPHIRGLVEKGDFL